LTSAFHGALEIEASDVHPERDVLALAISIELNQLLSDLDPGRGALWLLRGRRRKNLGSIDPI
jgi:hypothetical protein